MQRLAALIAFLALGAAAHGQTLPEPRTIKINDRVYVLLGPIQHANRINQGYMINSTVIVGDKGVILVDWVARPRWAGASRRRCARLRTSPLRTW